MPADPIRGYMQFMRELWISRKGQEAQGSAIKSVDDSCYQRWRGHSTVATNVSNMDLMSQLW